MFSSNFPAVNSFEESNYRTGQYWDIPPFEKAGILKEITGRKRDKRYIYAEYVNILSEGTQI